MVKNREVIVIKLGGSLVCPTTEKPIDFPYLSEFKKLLEPPIEEGKKFVLVVGGGKICRKYQDVARANQIEDEKALHWIGIATTNLNAEMVRAYYDKLCEPQVIRYEEHYEKVPLKIARPILVSCGSRPEYSTDMVSVLLAKRAKAKTVISLKDVDGVYSEDPRINKRAERCPKLSWKEYLKIIGDKEEHLPGGNYPIDPVAARNARKEKISFRVLSGRDFESVENVLGNKPFAGTTIS